MTSSVALKKVIFFVPLLTVMQVNAALPTCESEIKDVNTFLSLQGTARINDVDDLAKILRSLTQTGRLPPRYITSDEAKRQGWSGNETETLWGIKPTNNKWIGGITMSVQNFPQHNPGLAPILMFLKDTGGPND